MNESIRLPWTARRGHRVLGFGSVIWCRKGFRIGNRRHTTIGGTFEIKLYEYPNPVTGGDHLLAYRPEHIGD